MRRERNKVHLARRLMEGQLLKDREVYDFSLVMRAANKAVTLVTKDSAEKGRSAAFDDVEADFEGANPRIVGSMIKKVKMGLMNIDPTDDPRDQMDLIVQMVEALLCMAGEFSYAAGMGAANSMSMG